ncbi:hypothetical protein G6514_003231 [Epicoccum nigrum]|nr:hypothetical protein G6514_003231 [Epicoccum nigrum]
MSAPICIAGERATENFQAFGANRRETTVGTYDAPGQAEWRKACEKYCLSQPPKPVYLSPSRLPSFRSRRSTPVNKPELDALFEKFMVMYRGKKYLPLVPETLHQVHLYLMGAKLVAQPSLTKLLFNEETNRIEVQDFHASLVQIGECCTHLAVVAPFNVTNLSNPFDRVMGGSGPRGDWEKVLIQLPNLCKLTVSGHPKEPELFAEETYSAIHYALADEGKFKEYVDVHFEVDRKLVFKLHHDYHRRNGSAPLTMVGPDVTYADVPGGFAPEGDAPSEEDDPALFGMDELEI